MSEKDEAFKQSEQDKADEAEASKLDVEQGPDGTVVIGTRDPKKAWEKGSTRTWEPPVPDPNQPKSPGVLG